MRRAARIVPPKLRPVLGRMEARLRGFAGRLNGRNLLESTYPTTSFGRTGAHTFFGYFDISPFHLHKPWLLAHEVSRTARPDRDPAQLGLFDLESGLFRKLGETDLWCWQMGARLRWLPDGLIAWNTLHDASTYGSVIVDETGQSAQKLQAPLYDVDAAGRYGLSLDFSRLQRLRPGYGYASLPDLTEGDPCPASGGIDLIELKTGRNHRLLSLPDIAAIAPQGTMRDATHYLNHLSFSPRGDLFCVFHIWQTGDGRRRVRHLVFDLEGRLRAHIPGQEHISHFDWTADGTGLIAFARLPGDRTPLYQMIDLETGVGTPLAGAGIRDDGHPMMKPGTEPVFVSDTYPDRTSYRHLYLCDITTGDVTDLAAFHSPPGLYGERRCDLHPRWSHDGRLIAVDSAHTDTRVITVLDLGANP